MPKWLVKTEPDLYSIADLKRDKATAWTCVRNYQARNYLKEMKVGDEVLFYHSVSEPHGIMGLAKVKAAAYPDPTQFEKDGEYYDPKATQDNPRWFSPELQFVSEFREPISVKELRAQKKLAKMVLLQRGSRLSVQPVSEDEFKLIMKLANG